MKRSDFNFSLPPELIAQHPLAQRTDSRLLCLEGDSGEVGHRVFSDLGQLLRAGDLLVLNNTRVIPARLWAQKETGGALEILIERVLNANEALAHVRSSKSPKPGSRILLKADADTAPGLDCLHVIGREGALFHLRCDEGQDLMALLQRLGHMPLPPYIARSDAEEDRERYQTVFAQQAGAVAAPTAGLHFSRELLQQLAAAGINSTTVTLHVGAGTFQPVRADDIRDHAMHAEAIEVSETTCEAVRRTRAAGGRVVAVGTTAVRSLESACQATGEIAPFKGDSTIFIYPGYRFAAVDAMITNFHLPESTLLMLVSAFAGRENVLAAYREAVAQSYRFFSYGDAMFVTPAQGCTLAQ